ncbi:hypothetical protein ACE1CM_39115 [Microseira sp. BLCC-F43]
MQLALELVQVAWRFDLHSLEIVRLWRSPVVFLLFEPMLLAAVVACVKPPSEFDGRSPTPLQF